LHRLIQHLVRADTGREDPLLTEQVLVLFEGVTTTASYRGVESIAAARDVAALLIAHRVDTSPDHDPRTDK
jgi:hypothetical protein